MKKKQRTFWVRPVFRVRKLKGEFHTLILELKIFDSGYFFRQFRMTPTKLEELLSQVAPKIEKSSVRREPIGPEQRFCVKLWYLVTRDAHVTIAASYRISRTSTCRIIKETTGANWDVLLEKGFLQPPQSSKDRENKFKGFENRWNFPRCVGALDGKHVVIQTPAKSGSLFFNYNASHKFTAVDIGEAGRQSDSGAFANSDLGRSIVNGYFSLPLSIFVGEDVFPMRHNLLKPYSSSNLEHVLLIFNYILSGARRIIGNIRDACCQIQNISPAYTILYGDG